jgi:hypothetical protein
MSPLVSAVLNGRLAVLDGLHRVHPSTLNVLHRFVLQFISFRSSISLSIRHLYFLVMQRLVHERELQLHDGSRILNPVAYDALKEELAINDQEMTAKGILRAHPSFRIIALAEGSASATSQKSKEESFNYRLQYSRYQNAFLTRHRTRDFFPEAGVPWLNAEILSMFMFHHFPEISVAERLKIIGELVSDFPYFLAESTEYMKTMAHGQGDTSIRRL